MPEDIFGPENIENGVEYEDIDFEHFPMNITLGLDIALTCMILVR